MNRIGDARDSTALFDQHYPVLENALTPSRPDESWSGAEGVISSQRFWATAHHCTNDVAELSSADTILIEVAKDLRDKASGTPAVVLDLFIRQYSKLKITESVTACLACFSRARDDEEQWRKYGDDGRGICLGLPVLDEPGPEKQPSALIEVDYSESSWRDTLRTEFGKICSYLSKVPSLPVNLELGVSALNRIAAFQSIAAKQPGWAVEQEVRHVTLVPRSEYARMQKRDSGGSTIWFLPVVVRATGKRIALAEILIGPNRDTADTRERLEKLLADNGYAVGSPEYPAIAASSIPSWHV